MSKTIAQIYGVLTDEDIRLCEELGVEHVGVVFGSRLYADDHQMSCLQLKEYFEKWPEETVKIGLQLNTNLDEVLADLDVFCPDVLHLSGDPKDFPPEAVAKIREKHPGVKIMQAVPVDVSWKLADVKDDILAFIKAYEPVSDYFLIDSVNNAVEGIGATGATHDWEIDKLIVDNTDVPVIIAGGLDATNVADAIRVSRPYGVDSFTRTSYPRGVAGGKIGKDPEKLRAFIEAIRNA